MARPKKAKYTNKIGISTVFSESPLRNRPYRSPNIGQIRRHVDDGHRDCFLLLGLCACTGDPAKDNAGRSVRADGKNNHGDFKQPPSLESIHEVTGGQRLTVSGTDMYRTQRNDETHSRYYLAYSNVPCAFVLPA